MSNNRDKSRGLGRGLSALLADVDLDYGDANQTNSGSGTKLIPTEWVVPNNNQPRRSFPQDAMDELVNSIKEKGIIQPLIVREISSNKFQIVAGERRWRAAQSAQLHEVPVIVREYSDLEVQEIAIIENIQREDLNVIEEAQAYQALMKSYGHTQEQVSQSLGKSRSHIANLLRLLNLPTDVQTLVENGQLSMGHARALVGAENPYKIAEQIIKHGLNVREVEAIVKKAGDIEKNIPLKRKILKDADTQMLEDELSASLSMRVEIIHKTNGEGQLKISYKNLEQLDEICKILSLNQ